MTGRGTRLVVHRLGEFLHRLFLLRRQLFRNRDVDLHDQITFHAVLLDSLPSHAEALPRRRTSRNLDGDFGPVDGLHADLRTKRGLSDVDLDGRDEIEAFALVEAIWL